ncbi:hypothetical protein B0H14DRAFT_2566120 [Mycena olivaceomarginata]|nr:hypothetical protein B0H14DRAFT_2566120 [Mycena olivaceomarginata]
MAIAYASRTCLWCPLTCPRPNLELPLHGAFQDPFGRNKRANLNYYDNRLCCFLEGFLGEGGMSSLKTCSQPQHFMPQISQTQATPGSEADISKNNKESTETSKKTPTKAQRKRRCEANRKLLARYRERYWEELHITERKWAADQRAYLKTLEPGDETLEAVCAHTREHCRHYRVNNQKTLALKQRKARKKAFIEKHGAQEHARRARAAFRESVMDGTFVWKSLSSI